MARSQQSWQKQEREKKKQKDRKDKAEKKADRRSTSGDGGKSLNDMMAYVDEHGNIVDSPPDPTKRKEVNIDDIVIGVPKQAPVDPSELIRTGTITFFNDAKGFGFIRDSRTGESVFVHVNNADGPLGENVKVTYETERGPKGMSAINVKVG